MDRPILQPSSLNDFRDSKELSWVFRKKFVNNPGILPSFPSRIRILSCASIFEIS